MTEQPLKAKIIQFHKENPECTRAEVAKAVGCSASYVSLVCTRTGVFIPFSSGPGQQTSQTKLKQAALKAATNEEFAREVVRRWVLTDDKYRLALTQAFALYGCRLQVSRFDMYAHS